MQGSHLKKCIVGCNSYVGRGCDIQDTIILGNDSYTNESSRALSRKKGQVVLGIGVPVSPPPPPGGYEPLLISRAPPPLSIM